MKDKLPKLETNVLELAILMACCLAPMLIMANELSGDDFLKATTGAAFASMTAVILAAYKLWKSSK